MRTYDLIFLLDSDMPEDGRAKVVEAVDKATSATECKVVKTDDWGVRKLAYKIDHHSDAQYHLFRLEGQGSSINDLDKKLRLVDGLLRYRIVRQPESEEADWVDFKSHEMLRRFVSDRGKIRNRRACRVSRRRMSLSIKAIKQARELALLPYVSDK